MTKFRPDLLPSLNRLIARAEADYADRNSTQAWLSHCDEDERADATAVKSALRSIGFAVYDRTAYGIWSLYAQDKAAQWIEMIPRSDSAALGLLENLRADIAAGIDELGFSVPTSTTN